MRMLILSERSKSKDLSSYPGKIAVLPAPSFSGRERGESIHDSDSVGKGLSSTATSHLFAAQA
jgi:hypothetical protein